MGPSVTIAALVGAQGGLQGPQDLLLLLAPNGVSPAVDLTGAGNREGNGYHRQPTAPE